MTRKLLLAALVIAAITAGFAATGQAVAKPDFSGVWNLDLKLSRLQIPAPDSGVFRVEHQEPNFHLTRTFVTAGKEDTWSVDFTTDGKEVVQEEKTETFRGKLTWRGNDLFLDSTITQGKRVATNQVTYHLSPDGKTLTATEIFRGPYHTHDNIWIFDKQ